MEQVSEDISLLESMINEPHCESEHTAETNRTCYHKVVAAIGHPCGCVMEACVGQVLYSKELIFLGRRYYCHVHDGVYPSSKIHIIPKG